MDNTKVLNVFDLHTFKLIRTVPLSQTLGRIQGAKVYHGMLYAFADIGASLPLYKIDPKSGHVITAHHVNIHPAAHAGHRAGPHYDQLPQPSPDQALVARPGLLLVAARVLAL
jgi:hypothetical protein